MCVVHVLSHIMPSPPFALRIVVLCVVHVLSYITPSPPFPLLTVVLPKEAECCATREEFLGRGATAVVLERWLSSPLPWFPFVPGRRPLPEALCRHAYTENDSIREPVYKRTSL